MVQAPDCWIMTSKSACEFSLEPISDERRNPWLKQEIQI